MADPQINTGTVVVCISDTNAKGIKKKRYYHVIRQYVLGGYSYLELEGVPGRFFTQRFKVTMQ